MLTPVGATLSTGPLSGQSEGGYSLYAAKYDKYFGKHECKHIFGLILVSPPYL